MKKEQRIVTFGVYEVTGKSFLCPDNAPEEGDIVAAILPLQQVDPMKLYAFVIKKDGNTVTASKKFLRLKKKLSTTWERQPYDTAGQEKSRMIEVVRNYMKMDQ
jgi:hypothetical protein